MQKDAMPKGSCVKGSVLPYERRLIDLVPIFTLT